MRSTTSTLVVCVILWSFGTLVVGIFSFIACYRVNEVYDARVLGTLLYYGHGVSRHCGIPYGVWVSTLYTTGTGQRIYVHDLGQCKQGPCPVHNPSDHHMRAWPTHWRPDRKIMERLCPHGVGHPDPDCMYAGRDTIHGCDGCCRLPQVIDSILTDEFIGPS